ADAEPLVQLERIVAPRHLARVVAVGADVEADAEAPSLGPQYDHASVRLVVGLAQHALHFEPKLHAQRIELARTIERDDANLAVGLIEDLWFGHAAFPTAPESRSARRR